LFIVLSLFSLYLAILGCAVFPFTKATGNVLERVALVLGLGLLVNYCLMLTGQSIGRVLVVGMALGMVGILRLWKNIRSGPPNVGHRSSTTMFSVCCITYILIVHYFTALGEPLLQWDARSVWFFHARMIWTDGALRQQTGWDHPSIAFSSPDYPELVPALAAQLAYTKGYWNEFLPKGSLLIMLVPAVLWFFSFFRKRVSFALLALACFFGLTGMMWNGYMDGYLGLYCSGALLLLGRYLSEQRDIDLYAGLCALGLAANIKSEGLLFGICVVMTLFFVGFEFPAFSLSGLFKRLRTDFGFVRVLLISLAPALIWMFYKTTWGLQNYLTADPSTTWSRVSTRLRDGSTADYIVDFLVFRASSIWIEVGLIAGTILFLAHQGLKPHRGALVAAMTSALYVGGITVVFLSSPAVNLHWHLFTAAGRTMSVVMMALMVSMFFLLSDLEVDRVEA
jgi:hypothetical protein